MFNCVCRGIVRRWFCRKVTAPDTIYALASGSSRSPISIVRIGGQEAYRTLLLTLKDRLDGSSKPTKEEIFHKTAIKNRKAHLRSLYNHSKEVLDKSIVIFYPSENSYNGEDIVELHTHGSRAILKVLFDELDKLGFRMAERGQFTRRAIVNNKMDCLQAEGIHELIMSDSEFSRKIALKHLLGDTSKQIDYIKEELVSCLAANEAYIDFPGEEEDIKEELMDKIKLRVERAMKQIRDSLRSRKQVQLMTEGLSVAIVGRPNAGKSTIINKLVRREVAIVSDIPGTTRDLINASVEHKGIMIHLTDTAGLRVTEEAIEKEGIKRAVARSQDSHINVFVVDPTVEVVIGQTILLQSAGPMQEGILRESKTLLVVNKRDSVDLQVPLAVRTPNGVERNCQLLMSALQEDSLDDLLDRIVDEANSNYKFEQFHPEIMLSKERHFKALEEALRRLEGYVNQKLPVDIRCEELREAIAELGSITGKVDVQQILDVLFRDFCIGK